MTEQEKKRKFHRPMRLGLVAAAVAAMLVVTVSAANSEAIMTYLTSLRDAAVAGEAWADSPVNTEEGTGGLRLPEASLEERDGQAVISFKNTSRAPLDIPAEELLERFVRGDAARGGEGNGLGLSIARSLTELQQGTLDLTVDGDLFKATVTMPQSG